MNFMNFLGIFALMIIISFAICKGLKFLFSSSSANLKPELAQKFEASIKRAQIELDTQRGLVGSLPGLTGDRSDLWGHPIGLYGNCSRIWGDCSGLYGDCSNLYGCCTGRQGDCTGLVGDLADQPTLN